MILSEESLWRRFENVKYKERKTFIGHPIGRGKMSFAWWNTSVSPYGNGECKVDRERVIETITALSEENDFVGLGEFDDESMSNEILARLPRYKGFKSLRHESGRLQFKTALIYDLRMLESIDIEEEKANLVKADHAPISRQYRIGQKVRFRIRALDALVDVYLVHWCQKDERSGDEKKRAAAARLSRDIFGDEQCYINDAAAIVMGDFNSEPWSSVFLPLNVSRSSSYIKKNGGLYNPFWRRLHDEIGTLNEANFDDIRCERVLFDSIMMTAKFLKLPNCKWHERIYGRNFYDAKHTEHSPVGLKITWREQSL